MESEDGNEVEDVVDEVFEDNKDLLRDSASEAESQARKRKGILLRICRTLKCDYPLYLCCFCINPLGCMKSLQAVLLNWFGIIAAVTLLSQYWSTTLLELFQDNIVIFMYLGLACFWTAATLWNHMGKIAQLGKNLGEAVKKMLNTEMEVTKTLDELGMANHDWIESLEQLHEKNKKIRKVGRLLDTRKLQAEEQREELTNLLTKFGGKVTGAFQNKRIAIDNLIKEQAETLDEVQDNVNTLHETQEDFDGRAVQFQEDLEMLNETIGEINKPISDLEAIKPKLQEMVANGSDCEEFVAGNLQHLVVLERITILRELSYSRAIFFSALKNNGGMIDQPLFNRLVLRLPMPLRKAFESTTKSYQNYRTVQAKGRMGRKKYGPMNQEKVTDFLQDLEAQAFEVVQQNMETMPDPRRSVFITEKEEDEDVLAVFDIKEDEDTDDVEEEKVVIIT